MSAGRATRKKQQKRSNGHGPEGDASEAPERDLADAVDATEASAEAEAQAEAPSAVEVAESGVEAASEHAHDPSEAAAHAEPAGEDGAEAGGRTEAPPPSALDRKQQKAVLEALIFVSERTVTAAQLARAMKVRAAAVRELVAELMQDYQGRGMELIEVAGGYQLRSAPTCAPYVREYVSQRPVRLTRAQLETLALIAYRQPITRPEIDDVRGVDSGSAIRVLLERSLIKMLGRKDEPGRPLLYGTTSHFLEFFGMRSLKDLPTLREFTELTDENRALFKRKTGESVEQAEAELLAAEAARSAEELGLHVSDEDLAELAEGAETDIPPPREADAHDGEREAGPASPADDEREDEIETADPPP